MDEIERKREARDRRSVLNELGLPATATYYRVTLRRSDAAHNSVEQAEVLPDGRIPIVVPAFPLATRAGTVVWDFAPVRTVAVYGVDEAWDTAIARHASVPLWASSAGEAGLPMWSLGPGERGLPFIVLRYVARYAGLPLGYERRWHPDGEWTEGLVETQHRSTAGARAKVLAGRAALRAVEPHRTKGAGVESLERFLTRVESAIRELRRHRLLVTKHALIEALGEPRGQAFDDRLTWYREDRGVDLDWKTRLKPALQRWERGVSLFDLLGVDKPGKPGFSHPGAGRR